MAESDVETQFASMYPTHPFLARESWFAPKSIIELTAIRKEERDCLLSPAAAQEVKGAANEREKEKKL